MREATFFSRIAKFLRSTFDLSSSKTRVQRHVFRVIRCRFCLISSAFLPTCSNVLSNLALMLGMSSRIGLNSALRVSMSVPTSVIVNLSFLVRFFMANSIIESRFFVKGIFSKKLERVKIVKIGTDTY